MSTTHISSRHTLIASTIHVCTVASRMAGSCSHHLKHATPYLDTTHASQHIVYKQWTNAVPCPGIYLFEPDLMWCNGICIGIIHKDSRTLRALVNGNDALHYRLRITDRNVCFLAGLDLRLSLRVDVDSENSRWKETATSVEGWGYRHAREEKRGSDL